MDLFKQKKINYPEIMQIIKEITSLNFNSDVNTIDKIIQYHENLNNILKTIINLKIYLLLLIIFFHLNYQLIRIILTLKYLEIKIQIKKSYYLLLMKYLIK